jgi:hypothetical protein
LTVKREAHHRRESSVDSKRNTPVVDFGVERHTLVTEKITQIFHRSLAAVTQVAVAREHLFKVRAQLLRRLSESTCPIQGESRDSLPTQLRGGQGASIAWFLVRF